MKAILERWKGRRGSPERHWRLQSRFHLVRTAVVLGTNRINRMWKVGWGQNIFIGAPANSAVVLGNRTFLAVSHPNSVSKPNKLIGSPSRTLMEHLGRLVSSLGQIDTSLCPLGKIMGQLNWTFNSVKCQSSHLTFKWIESCSLGPLRGTGGCSALYSLSSC